MSGFEESLGSMYDQEESGRESGGSPSPSEVSASHRRGRRGRRMPPEQPPKPIGRLEPAPEFHANIEKDPEEHRKCIRALEIWERRHRRRHHTTPEMALAAGRRI